MKSLESFIYTILDSKKKKKLVIILTALAFFLSLLMFPSKLVLAKMLPGKVIIPSPSILIHLQVHLSSKQNRSVRV